MSPELPSWMVRHLACPSGTCRGELVLDVSNVARDNRQAYATMTCARCGAVYPMLAGIPVLVPDPCTWMASFRESVLAVLAEVDLLSPSAVSLIDTFAAKVPGAEPRRFGDDWVDSESALPEFESEKQPPQVTGDAALDTFLLDAARDPLESRMLRLAGAKRRGLVLEIGCGAGTLSAELATLTDRLLISDYSLRAVCRSQHQLYAAGRCGSGVVLEAACLPFSEGSMRLIAAQNVIDLLDDPASAIAEAGRVLTPQGRLIASTPDPELVFSGSEIGVRQLVTEAGLEIESEMQRVPWIRQHHARHIEVYFVDIISARHTHLQDDPKKSECS